MLDSFTCSLYMTSVKCGPQQVQLVFSLFLRVEAFKFHVSMLRLPDYLRSLEHLVLLVQSVLQTISNDKLC